MIKFEDEEPKLDFSEGYWRTEKDHNVYVKNWLPKEKVWKAYLLDDSGTILARITFSEEGRNCQYGDLLFRKRGAQTEGWPIMKDEKTA